MKSRELRNLGIPAGESVAVAQGCVAAAARSGIKAPQLREIVRAVVDRPNEYREHPHFGPLAQQLIRTAEARLRGAWSHMRPLEVSLDSFVGLTLPWLALRGWLVGPEHWAGPGALEVAPGDLKARLVTRPVAA